MLGLLSKVLFFFSSFSILPPERLKQEAIIKRIQIVHQGRDSFLKNSLCQYDCQSHFFLKMHWLLFNLCAVLGFIPLLILLSVRSLKNIQVNGRADIALYPKIPLSIMQEFDPYYVKKPIGFIRTRDWPFLLKIIFRSGFRPYFVFRSVWKIAVYSELIETYVPERIWVTQEMVFESSILTAYANEFHIKHNNFMHGDNYFSIQVAFCSFDEFYVWDEFYMDLFRSLKASVKKFVVFSALDRLSGTLPQKNILKYYNQETIDKKEFGKVIDNLTEFSKVNNCGLVVRLHPLHKKQYELDLLAERGVTLESNEVHFIDSIGEATFVCSEFSSVLYQASLLNRRIVIDNTFPSRIKIIKDLDVIFIKKLKHEYLVNV